MRERERDRERERERERERQRERGPLAFAPPWYEGSGLWLRVSGFGAKGYLAYKKPPHP